MYSCPRPHRLLRLKRRYRDIINTLLVLTPRLIRFASLLILVTYLSAVILILILILPLLLLLLLLLLLPCSVGLLLVVIYYIFAVIGLEFLGHKVQVMCWSVTAFCV